VLIEDSHTVLLTLLAESGLTPGVIASEQVRTVVDMFHRFVHVPVEDAAPLDEDGDGTLAQSGTSTWRGPREFEAGLTRQFIEIAGRDPQMWQVHCTLRWDASDETDGLPSGGVWSLGKPWDVFFAEAMRLPGWAWALETPRPATLHVALEMV